MPLLDLALKEKFYRDSGVHHRYFFSPKGHENRGFRNVGSQIFYMKSNISNPGSFQFLDVVSGFSRDILLFFFCIFNIQRKPDLECWPCSNHPGLNPEDLHIQFAFSATTHPHLTFSIPSNYKSILSQVEQQTRAVQRKQNRMD